MLQRTVRSTLSPAILSKANFFLLAKRHVSSASTSSSAAALSSSTKWLGLGVATSAASVASLLFSTSAAGKASYYLPILSLSGFEVSHRSCFLSFSNSVC